MKKLIFVTLMILVAGIAKAQKADTVIVDGVAVDSLAMVHSGDDMTIDILFDLKALSVNSNRAVVLTPRLVNGNDSIDLPSVGIYGRRRYFYYLRNGESMLTGKDETSYRASQKPARLPYRNSVRYAEWMNGAKLALYRADYGCCNSVVDEWLGYLGNFAEEPEVLVFFPELVYVQPKVDKDKTRHIDGSAFIDFPVDQTVIYPDYRRNTVELARIQATIDSVRDDKDVTITNIWLKGYASPESPYRHNTELAIGRTAALKHYIGQLYNFNDTLFTTAYEPEDWAGLRKYVEKSNLTHRDEILALIDSDMNPDSKELKIKRTYPEQYRFLLRNVYPALRHTDYRISYKVREYIDPIDIKAIMAKAPQKLSLDEFYILADEYEPGTDEFTDVYDTAVRMYPTDETANLNAANAAIRADHFAIAERYLAKAGNSAEAIYARGALAIRRGDYELARTYLTKAKELGLKQAGLTLDELDKKTNNVKQ